MSARSSSTCCSSASSRAERNEPPDIDVDFEHERREEVIAYHLPEIQPEAHRARRRRSSPIAAARRCARSPRRSACRTIVRDALAGSIWGWGPAAAGRRGGARPAGSTWADPLSGHVIDARQRDPGLSAPSVAACRRLRHHPGPARRDRADHQDGDGRTQDGRMGQGRSRRGRILKVDILALGMLSCLRRAFDSAAGSLRRARRRMADRSSWRRSRRRIRGSTT